MSENSPLAPRARRTGRTARGRGDRLVYLVFVVVPLLAFFGADLAGRPVIPGDDLTQNEPLRVLVGQSLRAGHLPSWDPFIWSGTPLLAGWNAAALFPGTFLFAILPAIPAWTVNYALAPALCACGMHLFLRRLGLRTLPAALGALVFTYTGFMSGQVVHIGLVQGTALTPFILVGLDGVARAATSRARAGWAAIIAISSTLVVLAGDPRAISNAAILALVYLVFLLIERRHTIRQFLLPLAAGVLSGVALSAVQWAPGIGFLHNSQRSSAAFTLFSQGSFTITTLLQSLLVPFLIGGNGNLGQGFYTGSVNPPEVTIGAGLVALVAACAYLPELISRVIRVCARRPPPPGPTRPLGLFYVLAALGALLALGSTTPLAHVLVRVPFFGGERLQNRNAALLDFALAAFVALLLDDLLLPRLARARRAAPREATLPPTALRRPPLDGVVAPLLALLPSAGAIALIAYAFARPLSLESHLNVLGVRPVLFKSLAPYLDASIAFAATVAIFVVLARWLPRRLRFALAATLVVCDVLTFALNAPYGSVAPSALSPGPLSAALTATLHSSRFALFDPSELIPGPDPYAVDRLGSPDLNVIAGNLSVQGYGSIVDGSYQDGTGTHYLEDVQVSSLGGSIFDSLDLTTLLTQSVYLDEQLPLGSPVPLALSPGKTRRGPGIPDAPPFSAGPWPLTPHTDADFVLPYPLPLAQVTVIFDGPHAPTRVAVAASPASGHGVTRAATVHAGRVTLSFPAGTSPLEFSVADLAGGVGTIGAFLVTTRGPTQRFILDGALQGVLTPNHWRPSTTLGPFLRFTNTRAAGLAWLEPNGVTSPLAAAPRTTRVTVPAAAAQSVDTVDVTTPRPMTLVRSEGYAPGWTATVRSKADGQVAIVPVRALGLVQAVGLPRGAFTVTFHYAPATEREGFILGALGALALLALVGYAALPRRRRARRT